MILSTLVPAFAATDVADLDCEDAVLRMEALDIIKGYEDGTFRPENTITRAEMAVIICKMTGITESAAEASKNVDSKFSDVKAGEWYTGYINIATGNGIIAGFPDGTFRPNEVLTLNQVLTLCVKALGRGAYVDQMGTWPANYVTEAAKLGLLDDVKSNSTDANRGNVAIIAWNTLQAKIWDVNETKLDGEVSLGNTAHTLLNTHFRSYCFDGQLKEVKEVPVVRVPSTDKEIGDRQIVLDLLNGEDTDFDFEAAKAFDKAPSKNEEDATYKELDGQGNFKDVVAYIPEEVYADIDDLLGRKVTVIFGDDNIVALVIVEDDVVNNEYATRYKDEKLTVGGETYKFATNFELYVNNVEIDDEATTADLEDEIENILGDTYVSTKDFEKNIKANVILDTKGKVSRLDLYVSGEFPEYLTTETVVGKVRNSVIYAQNGTKRLYDYDEDTVDEDDLPKVYVDGAKASIEDIKVGDVLTIYYTDADGDTAYTENEADTIYVSRKTAEGTISRIKNVRTLTIDGEAYTASAIDVAKILLLDEEDIKDAEAATETAMKKLVDEDVTLYLNIYGEYVLVASEDITTDYQFAVIEHIYDADEDDEDADLFTQKLRLFMADGTTSREYKVSYDKSEHDGDEYEIADPLDGIVETLDLDVGDFIAFSADNNKEIDIEDIYKVNDDATNFEDGYVVIPATVAGTTANFDDERLTVGGTTYRAKSSTVIFNANNNDPEIIKWKALVEEDPDKLVAKAYLVCEEDSTTISYIYINVDEDDTAVSSSEFAAVTEAGYTKKISGKTYIMAMLLDENGEEVELKDNDQLADEDYIVEYKTSSDKLSSANKLVDIVKVNDLKDSDRMAGIQSGSTAAQLLNRLTTTVAAVHGTVNVDAVDASHGTVACPNAANTTATNCTCTGFTAYVAEHAAAVNNSGSNCTECNAANGAAHSNTCSLSGYSAAVDAVHGTVACPDADDTTATTCTCTGFTAYVAEHEEDCDGSCGGTCDGYEAAVTSYATKEAFAIDEIDGKFLIYNDDEDLAVRLDDVKVDTDEVVVFDVTGSTPTVVNFSDIEVGDLVVAFGGADGEATLLVIVK